MIVWIHSQILVTVMLINGWHLLLAILCSMALTNLILCRRNWKILLDRNYKLLLKLSICIIHHLLRIDIYLTILLLPGWILYFVWSNKVYIKLLSIILNKIICLVKIFHNRIRQKLVSIGIKLSKWSIKLILLWSIRISLSIAINDIYI